MKATIDPEGRIALGRELQRQLGLKPGDEVVLEKRGSELIVKPANGKDGLCREGNVLVHRGSCTESIEEALETIRKQRLENLGQGEAG
jgi:AbrB family looped-hinge helix DNA binding protein